MSVKIAVVGAGAWGTTIAQCFADNGHHVLLWCYNNDTARLINHDHLHRRLPGVELNNSIQAVTDMTDCYDVDYFIFGFSSSQLIEYDQKIDWKAIRCPIGVLAKGLIDSNVFISDWISLRSSQPIFVISGPNLALEIAQRKMAATVVASINESVAKDVQLLISTTYFRAYSSTDVRGVECGGVFKNVYAIAAGALDGLSMGDNAKAALVTRGLVELQRLVLFFKGNSDTVLGLSGLGDLMVTCSSSKSRNWQLGHAIVTTKDKSQWFSEDRGQTEGGRTVDVMHSLMLEHSLDLPIMMSVWRMLFSEATPKQIINDLMKRGLKSEIDN